MKKYVASLFFLLAVPAFGTISNVQSNANWSCSGSGVSVVCTVQLTTYSTTSGNLIAVWAFWPSTSTYTASVHDSITTNTFVTAVGPTLQASASTPTTAQIFYASQTIYYRCSGY